MKKPLFSVIVPVFNAEKYLNDCIKSVLNQDMTNYELILVDDGSKDNCANICDEFALQDERIKVVHKENGGATSARKMGADIACGEYILTLDSDDMFVEGAFSRMKKMVLEHRPDVICFGFSRFPSDNSKEWLPTFNAGYYQENELEELKNCALYYKNSAFFTYGIATGTCLQCVKREIFLHNQLPVDEQIVLGEDLCVTIPNVLEAKSVYILKDALIKYRQVQTSISHKFRKDDIVDLKRLLAYLDKTFHKDKNNIEEQLSAYCLHRILSALNNFAKNAQNLRSYKELLRDIDAPLLERLDIIELKKVSFKTRVILYCIKYKFWIIFWLLYKR